MSFSFWGQSGFPSIDLSIEPGGYLLVLLYAALYLWVLYRERDRLLRLTRPQMAIWFACLLLSLILGNLLVFQFGGPPLMGGGHSLALLAGIPIVIASTVGLFPAATVGFAAGLIHSTWVSHQLFGAFEMALWGLATAYLIRQDYSGRLPRLVRFPLIAAPVGALAMWATFWLSGIAYRSGNILQSILRCTPSLLTGLPFTVLIACGIGLTVQLLFLALPSLVPSPRRLRIPPYAHSLKAGVLSVFIPSFALTILGLVSVVNVTAVSVAQDTSISQAARDTDNAAQRIPFMIWTGQGLLSQLAQDDAIWNETGDLRQQRLQDSIRTTGFFKEILLLDRSLNTIDAYPPPGAQGQAMLETEEEKLANRVVDSGASQISSVYRRADGGHALSFLAPVMRSGDAVASVVIGRADADQAPMIRDVVKALQNTMDTGIGFVVDERNLVIAHPDPARILTPWVPNPQPDALLRPQAAYMETGPNGNQWLVYYRSVEGHPWKTVIQIPYETILALAARISTPFTIILLCMGFIAGALIALFSAQLTRPLEALSLAATSIARGQLDAPVTVSGETEVGRLGAAFEMMRARLQKRLQELALLLNISRAVSANPDLHRNLEPILTGVLQAIPAVSARIILVSPTDAQPEREISASRSSRPVWRKARGLSGPLLRLVQGRRSVKVHDTSLYPGSFSEGAGSAFGVPLLLKNRLVGLLLVEYKSPNDFEDSQLDFLSTLAGQAAVVVENSRLFEAVESERQRLSAVVTSASDPIIGSDRNGAVLLINPAARRVLGLNDPGVVGQAITALGIESDLAEMLLRTSPEPDQPREIVLPNEHTLSAIVSPIVNAQGEVLGRVAVMHDITHLKEIDAMKSNFLQLASHDLRSPLQTITGYTGLILGEGGLSTRQEEWIGKVGQGIQDMTKLITDLLDITKIEAGAEVNMVNASIDDIIRDVAFSLKARAQMANLRLDVEIAAPLSPIRVDVALVRQAIANLVDNAIKYTPAGFVRIRAERSGGELIVSVQDSGLGIPLEAQERLFEKFYRVKTRETIKIRGSGLGLAIVKSIVELHRGRVWVESESKKGSTFFLALPISERMLP